MSVFLFQDIKLMWHPLLFLDGIEFQVKHPQSAINEQGKRTGCVVKVLCNLARIKWNKWNLIIQVRKLCEVDSFNKYFADYWVPEKAALGFHIWKESGQNEIYCFIAPNVYVASLRTDKDINYFVAFTTLLQN